MHRTETRAIAIIDATKDASLNRYIFICASMLLCSSLQAGEQPKVVLGGTSGLPSLADPSATSAFRAAPDTGFYLHFSATDPLFTTALRSIGKVFATKQTVVEVSLGGGFTPQFWTTGWKTSVTSYGFSPHVAAVNVDMANVDAPESAPTVEVEQFETFVKAARANGGVQILAPVISPNSSGGGGLEGDARTIAIKHPWADRWWDNMRSIARFGGGIVLDAPPAFFLRALPDPAQIRAYQAFAIAELRWAAEQHLWSAFIVSPYFDAISFQSDSEKAYRILREADALPQTWIVENYSECGAPYPKACSPSDGAYRAPVGRDDLQNTEASVALWFATKAASLKIEER